MGLFNNGMSRYIKNRAPVLGIQKDLFFMSFFFSRNEDYFFHPFSLYITKGKERFSLLHIALFNGYNIEDSVLLTKGYTYILCQRGN